MLRIQWLKTPLFMLLLTGIATGVLDNSTEEVDSTPIVQTETTTTTATVVNTVTTVQIPLLPTTADVCGLSLISPSEQDQANNRKCRCSDFDEEVDCSYLDVTELPKLISFPKSARDVSFLGNKIQNIEQDTFYNGKSVLDLDLSHNRIDFVSIVAFQAFKNLRRLDLSHNKIWNMPPKSFEVLHSLRFLDLGYNDLVSLSSDLFSGVPDLTELDLESNPLQELEPKVFEHLKNLEILNLESTLLKIIPDHLFFFTPHLKLLDMSNNQLTYVPTDSLKVLHNLKLLDLSGNPINIIQEEAFIGMRGLVLLYLNRMPRLTEIGKYAFGDLQQLQELQCSYNFLLSEVDETAFVKKSDNKKVALSQLFLRQNSLTSLPRGLLGWDGNVELHISENPLYCDCNTEWMVHLHLKNEFQKHVKCFGPSHLQGLTLDQVKDHEMACGLELSEIVLIVLACVVFLLILALIIAFMVWRRSYSGHGRPRYFRVSKKKPVDVEDRIDDGI